MRLVVAFVFSLFALSGAHAQDRLFNAASFVLDNGLKVVVLPDHRAPVVTQMIWYRVGSADEEPGKGGLAHFLEHLMFKGTEDYPGKTFSNVVNRYGGQENAFTSRDITAYYQTVPRRQLHDIMAMEAARMTGLTLNQAEVDSERDVVREERRQRVGNNPSSILSEQVTEILFGNHPYGKPVIGSDADIEGLTRENAFDFYKRFYSPSNAVLVLVGDVTVGDGLALAKTYYGPLENRKVDHPVRPAIGSSDPVEDVIELDHELVTDLRWQRRYIAPGSVSGSTRQAAALSLVSDILGNGSNSRLYKRLVVEKKLASYAAAWYSSMALDDDDFTVYAVARPGVTADQLQTEVDAVIADFIKNGPTEDERSLFVDSNINELIYARDDVESAARIFGNALVLGLDVAAINNWPNELQQTSLEDIRQAAVAIFTNNRSITAVLRPKAETAEAQ